MTQPITLIFIIVFIIVLILLFIVTREFWCWYWKINMRIKQLDSINNNLEQIKTLLIHQNPNQGRTNIADSKDELPEL